MNMKKILFILVSIVATSSVLFAQEESGKPKENTTENLVTNLVHSKHYVFVAETVAPVSGASRSLTSYYDLTISGDTMISYLPYFGRSYSAPVDPSEGGINFTSTDFTYEIKPKKKGGWDILIKPKNVRSAQQLSLFISDNGYASLQVISNNRQPISFSGHIREKSEKK
jgi:hypothetical protein